MNSEKVETQVKEPKFREVKEYVKPTVTKHKAASLLVGSGCGFYVSQSSGGAYYY